MKQNEPVIGLTGGIGSGKSTVSQLLKEKGGFIVDADLISHQATATGTDCYDKIVAYFGGGILFPDGQIRRKALGQIVFQDPEKRKTLESIVHAYVKEEMGRQMAQARTEKYPFTVLDVPLLFGSGLEPLCREIWLVYAPMDVRIRRIQSRDGLEEEEIIRRIQAQMPWETMRQKGHVVIDNGTAKQETKRQVEQYLHDFLKGE